MSYILEALKKAQAERQLGDAPTIHSPQPVAALQPARAASRRPLLVGLGAGALVVAAGALLLWRAPSSAPAGAVAAGAAVDAAGANRTAKVPAALPAPAVEAAAPAALPAPPVEAAAPAALPAPPVEAAASAALPAPPVDAAAPVAAVQAAPARTAPAQPASSAKADAPSDTLEVSAPPPPPRAEARPAETRPAPARLADAGRASAAQPGAAQPGARSADAQAGQGRQAPPAASARTPAAAPEDSLPFLQQLPDAIQREVPRVTFGGYMYSANPADRLLLVDKSLRHEGEEVAPGLVLEKLLPRAAVMNYRGYRYRVAY